MVKSVTWRGRVTDLGGGVVVVAYAKGAVSRRPGSRAAAERFARSCFGPDCHPERTDSGWRWTGLAVPGTVPDRARSGP